MTDRASGFTIGFRQNFDLNMRRQAAARTLYSRAKRARHYGLGVGFILALAAPLLLAISPDDGVWLAGAGALWLFVSRLYGERYASKQQTRGAIIQDGFDQDVLGIEARVRHFGTIAIEEIRSLAHGDLAPYRDWYSLPVDLEWPSSVLACMRANAVWSFRQHRVYAYILRIVAFGVLIFDIIFSLTVGTTVDIFVAIIVLPTLPLLLDLFQYAQRHRATVDGRQHVFELVQNLSSRVDTVEQEDLRQVQDLLFDLRSSGPLVPNWLYKLLRGRFERDMKYASQHTAEEAVQDRPS